METVNEFTNCMRNTLEEAKAALSKAKDDMAKYYDRRRGPTPIFRPGDQVYLDASDIQTTRPSRKLSHRQLGPFPVEKQVGQNAYHLKLPPSMNRLHPVFNVVKLSPAPEDPIPGRQAPPPPPPEIVDGQEEYVVERVLDSRMFWNKLQYLIKWEGYGYQDKSWKPADNVYALYLVAEFHQTHPRVPQKIWALLFKSLPFKHQSFPITSS